MAVKILIDSASDINESQAKEMGVILMPIEVTFGETTYLDGVDLSTEEFYNKLTGGEYPKTSQINSYRYEEIFKQLTDEGHEVVAICLSSGISGTYNNAKMASSEFDGKVYAIDSLSASSGMRVLCEVALKLLEQGKSAKEISEILEKKKHSIRVVAMIDTLTYLKKGGRCSGAAAAIGNMLSLKPMVTMINTVNVIGKCVGAKKAFAFLDKYIKDSRGIDFDLPHCVIWSGNNTTNLDKFMDTYPTIWEDKSSEPRYCLGSTIGSHIGPGAVGVVFFEKD